MLLILAVAVATSAQTKTEKPVLSKNADDEKAIQAMLAISGKGWAARDAKLRQSEKSGVKINLYQCVRNLITAFRLCLYC
jgi:hypothetical protein